MQKKIIVNFTATARTEQIAREEATQAFNALLEAYDNMTDEVLMALTDEQFAEVKSLYHNGEDECMMLEYRRKEEQK
jgi:hypothetical protein